MRKQEDEVIRKIQGLTALRGPMRSLSLGMGDDAALWKPALGFELILTCDWFLEGTHFLRKTHPADAVGWKCLARAVSDIAAMGGTPRCFLLSLAIPQELTGRWFGNFLEGLGRAARELNCPLAGGDTTRREEVLINTTVLGEISPGEALLRSGARAGDGIYVSGRLGEAELGLELVRRTEGKARATNSALKKHLYPRPRIDLGRWLSKERLASGMMDLSDGLSSDLGRLCRASGVGARIQEDSLPVTSLTPRGKALALALDGGDDYELLFTVRKQKVNRVPKAFRRLQLTKIGEITRESGIRLEKGNGRIVLLRPGGWDPFRRP